VINDQPRVIADSFVVPDEALDLVPRPLRHAAAVTHEPLVPEEILAMTFTQRLRKRSVPGCRFRVLLAAASRGSRRDSSENRLPSGPSLKCLRIGLCSAGLRSPWTRSSLTPVPDGTPTAMHIHPHLSILVNGLDQVIPAGIGVEAQRRPADAYPR